MELTVNGLKIRYSEQGSGPCVVFLHGWGSSGEAFSFYAKVLSVGYRVISPDLPGFGGSDSPPAPWTVEDYCTFFLSFLDALNIENPILIGHSFGGRLIIKLCGTDRIRPDKIILIDAAGIQSKKSLKTRTKQTAFKCAKWLLSRRPWQKNAEPVIEKMRNRFGSSDYNNASPVMKRTLVNTIHEDLSSYLSAIHAPTLLIYGENDTATPLSHAHIMEREIPDAGLCIIKGAGHWAMAEKPFEVCAILKNFLNLS